MRYLPLLLLLLSSVLAGEPTYPLWGGSESVADYAKRVNLPPTKTLDLGSGVKMELVLIPAGKFIMGTPEPTPVDEAGFGRKIITPQVLFFAFLFTLLTILRIVIRAKREKSRRQVSLGWLTLMTLLAGGCVLSMHYWITSTQKLEAARAKFAAEQPWYRIALDAEKPAHPVTLTKPFYLGKFAVTQEQYQQITDMNPSWFKTNKDNPVERVSWNDVQDFCKTLAARTKQSVRLPTQAEFEYSCRAGTTSTFYSGETIKELDRVAWYDSNSNRTTHPVGQKAPNTFGLYDMHGNVEQWCQDWYAEKYYAEAPIEDPVGPPQGTGRVLRGGSWIGNASNCRAAGYFGLSPSKGNQDSFIGFRVVMDVVAK